MPSIRTSRSDRRALAVHDLIAAADGAAGISISPTDSLDRVTVELAGSDGWSAIVHPRSSLSPGDARALVENAIESAGHLVVADQISAEAKEYLVTAPEWGWLDRRSDLRIRHGDATLEIRFGPGGLHPDPDQGVALAAPAADGPIRGRAGISYAAAVLLGGQGGPPSIRSVARAASMAPSTISDAAGHLRQAGLVRPDGTAELPDLFDALAAVWRPIRALPVASLPDPTALERLDPNVEDLTDPGWAQGGDEAAAAWRAPMFLIGSRPWIWVPDETSAARAEQALGPSSWNDALAIVATPPTPLVCLNRRRAPTGSLTWPTIHPLYLALELARDPGRGREILEGWSPPEPDPLPWIGSPS